MIAVQNAMCLSIHIRACTRTREMSERYYTMAMHSISVGCQKLTWLIIKYTHGTLRVRHLQWCAVEQVMFTTHLAHSGARPRVLVPQVVDFRVLLETSLVARVNYIVYLARAAFQILLLLDVGSGNYTWVRFHSVFEFFYKVFSLKIYSISFDIFQSQNKMLYNVPIVLISLFEYCSKSKNVLFFFN